ncbi:hypothetical protein L6164_034107 [Bauhinia variegata]|uniref:Uncharacterized protein n=1 Tax=Bauhinia variegata TaxID=167791 RepID=A0ACB9KTX2_BAUVA|nr:hypothetical protein L6164_034107 [Bauhinia variegata]
MDVEWMDGLKCMKNVLIMVSDSKLQIWVNYCAKCWDMFRDTSPKVRFDLRAIRKFLRFQSRRGKLNTILLSSPSRPKKEKAKLFFFFAQSLELAALLRLKFRVAGRDFSMGEAPAFLVDDLHDGHVNGFDLKNETSKTVTIVGDKKYVIGGADDETASIEVQIFDHNLGEWVKPTVLGTKPLSCNCHSSVLLNNDRILIIKKGSKPDDHVWFLEVDTPYVRQQKKALGTEVVAWSKGVIGNAEKPIVISGPSGVGKGTLISMLMKEFPYMFGFSVSHTTRAPRGMEKDGVHYHFTEKSVMEKDIRDGKFLEFASVHGNLYGTSVEAVEQVADAGKRCILDIDVQGARSVKASSLEAIFIFICPPSMEELEKRLRDRGTETEEQILKRLRNAKAEIEQGKSSGIFDFILYNDNLEECYQSLKKLLGLNGHVIVPTKSARELNIPMDHSVSKVDDKIIINNISPGPEKESKNLIMLDVSDLKGGAPGRTRGLNFHAIHSFSDCLNGMDQLS